jgi:hypothetical protein
MTQLIPSLLPPKRTYVPRSSVPEESYRKGWHLFLWNARVRQCPTLGPPGPLNPRSPSSIPYSFLSLPLFPILTPYLSWYLWVSPPLPIGGVPPFAHASYPNSSGGDLRVVQYVNSSINLRLCQLRYCDQTPRYTTCSSPITPNPFRALPYAKINSLLPHSLTQPHFPHDCEILPSQQPSIGNPFNYAHISKNFHIKSLPRKHRNFPTFPNDSTPSPSRPSPFPIYSVPVAFLGFTPFLSGVSARQLGEMSAGRVSGTSFSGRLSGRMPARATPYPGGERVGVGVVDGGSVPRRWAHSLRG